MDIDDLPLHDSEVNEGHLDPEIGCSSIDVVTDQLAQSGPAGLAAAAAIHSSSQWYNEDHSYVGDFDSASTREFLVGDLNQNPRDCSMDASPPKLMCHPISRSPIDCGKSYCDVDKPSEPDNSTNNGFIANPVARNRLNTRLLRKIRLLITHMAAKCGQQASLVLLNPGLKGSEAKRNFRVFGSEPLSQTIRTRKFEIMRDFMGALNEQAELLAQKKTKQSLFEPNEWRENVKDESLDMGFSSVTEVSAEQGKSSSDTIGSYFSAENQMHAFNQSQVKHPILPPLQVDSIPTPLKLMTASQLRIFIPFMLKSALNRGKPGWGNEMWCPPWWPMEIIPWENVRTDSRLPEQKKTMSYKEALREVVHACYLYHNQEHLLDVLNTPQPHNTPPRSAPQSSYSTNHVRSSKTNSQLRPTNDSNIKVLPQKTYRVKLLNWNTANTELNEQQSRVLSNSNRSINEQDHTHSSLLNEQVNSAGSCKSLLLKNERNPESLYLLTAASEVAFKGRSQIVIASSNNQSIEEGDYSNMVTLPQACDEQDMNDPPIDTTQFLQSENVSQSDCNAEIVNFKASSKLPESCGGGGSVGCVRYAISLASNSADSSSTPLLYPTAITIPAHTIGSHPSTSNNNGQQVNMDGSCVSIKHLVYLPDSSSPNIISIKADNERSEIMNSSPRIRLVYDAATNSFVPRDSLISDNSSLLINNLPAS